MADWINDLARLGELRDGGLITEAEFEAAKARVLAHGHLAEAGPVTPEPAVAEVESLPRSKPEWPEPSPAYEPPEGVSPSRRWPLALAGVVAFAIMLGGLWWLMSGVGAGTVRTAEARYTDVNCRSEAGVRGDVKEVIARGTAFKVEQVDGDWAKVAGKGCWVRASNIEMASEQSAGGGKSSALSAAPSAVAAADLTPGEFTHYADGSGNSTQAKMSQLCGSATKIGQFLGTPSALGGWIVEGGPLGRIANNGGYSFGTTATDSDGVCRQQMAISGSDQGSSYNWHGSCRVTTLQVYDDHTVGVGGVDKNDCS